MHAQMNKKYGTAISYLFTLRVQLNNGRQLQGGHVECEFFLMLAILNVAYIVMDN